MLLPAIINSLQSFQGKNVRISPFYAGLKLHNQPTNLDYVSQYNLYYI